jgi:hypothetical protein
MRNNIYLYSTNNQYENLLHWNESFESSNEVGGWPSDRPSVVNDMGDNMISNVLQIQIQPCQHPSIEATCEPGPALFEAGKHRLPRAKHVWMRALLPLAIVLSPAAVSAQSYIPAIVPTASATLYASSAVVSPGRVAVDKAGNVFFIAVGSSSSSLMEIPASSPPLAITTPTTLITGLGQYNAKAVVVDVKGNLWASTGNQAHVNSDYINLVEIPGANGIPNTSLVSSGMTLIAADATHCTATGTVVCTVLNYKLNDAGGVINGPQALDFTIDASGNITYVDIGDNNLPSGKSRVAASNVYNGNGSVLVTVPQDYNAQVAVDGAGKVYYCSPTAGTVSLVSGGTLATVGNTTSITAAMVSNPSGISGDYYGNVFISGGALLSEVPFEGAALNFTDEFGIAAGLGSSISNGGSLDQNGNYYYASNGSSSTKIQQLQINGYNFGSVAVGATTSSSSTPVAPSLALYDNVAQSGVSSYFPTGSPTTNTTALYLQSFPYSGTKSFSGGSAFAVGSTYTITMNFQPIHPGLLKGSFTPRSSGNDDAIINLQGNGVGPEPLFFPGTPSQLFTAVGTKLLNAPQGIAIDTYGDIFLADTANGTVDADCLASTTQNEDGTGGNTSSPVSNTFCSLPPTYANAITALGTGFVSPVAIALDGAQSLYVLDSAATGTPVTVINGQSLASTKPISATTTFGGTALSGPMGIAVDGFTNIYIADTGNNRIVEAHQYGAVQTDNTVYIPSATTFGATKLSGPTGLAIDAAQNLYIADTGNNRVVKYSATGVATVVSTGSITLNAPYAVAVYPSGQLVVTDHTNGVVLLNGASSMVLSFGNPYTTTNAKGIALDATGNIYLSNTVGNQVLELNVNSPQPVKLPNTNVGVVSSSVSETVTNEGNASLVLTGLATSNGNFTLDSSSTCTSTSTVLVGNSCAVAVDFSPLSVGPQTASVTLTDNQLGYTLNTSTPNETATFAASGTQALNLSGTATSAGAPQTITFPAPASPIPYTTSPITLSATAGSSLPVSFTVLTGPGTISGNSLTITGVGTITIAANQPGSINFSAAPQVTQNIVVNLAPQTIAFAPTTPVTYTPTIALSATSSSGLTVSFSLVSGPATLSGSALTLTGIGTVVVSATQPGNANYAAATNVQQSIVVNPIGTVAAPVLSLAGGMYNSAYVPALAITDSTPGATIYYTVNGSTPSTSSTQYSGTVLQNGITLSGTETIQAIAVLTGYTPSPVVSASFNISTATEALTYAMTPTSLTLQRGQSGTINITVTPQNGIVTQISFECTGLPIGATCSFNPATVATGPTQTPVSTVLTVTAPATLIAMDRSSHPYLAGTTLAAVLLLLGGRKRRRLPIGLLLAAAVLCLGVVSGCGSSVSGQTSIVTVAISGDSVRGTAPFTLTVQ